MAYQSEKGVVDAADRILARLLESPSFKNSVRIFLNNMDPGSAGRLVRTAVWRDMEFSLSCIAASPALFNILINLADEALTQTSEKFPGDMLKGYMEDLLRDIDREALARVREKALAFYEDLSPMAADILAKGGRSPAELSRGEGQGGPGSFESRESPGLSQAGAGQEEPCGSLLGEILRTPFLKQILRELLNGIEPEKGAEAARTIIWEDPETTAALLASFPAVINFCIHAAGEIGVQVNDKIPPRLILIYASELFSEIDRDAAEKGLQSFKNLALGLAEEAGSGPAEAAAAHSLAACINRALAEVNRLEQQNPGALKNFMNEAALRIDKDEAGRAFRHITDAFLDQRPPVFSLAWRAVKAYIRAVFRRRQKS